VPERATPPAAEAVAADGSRDLRLSRGLFYLGCLTVVEASWRPVAGLTVSETLFLAAVGTSFVAVLRGRAIAPVPGSLIAGVAVFSAGGTISSLGAQSPASSGIEVLHGIYVMLLWGWSAAMVLRTRAQVLRAVTLWTASATISGIGALLQVTGLVDLTGPLEGNRATGFTEHPNDLGGASGIALVPALLMATRGGPSPPLAIALRWTVVGLIATGLVLSGSVAGMAAGLAACLFWLSSPTVRVGTRAGVIAALAAALAIATLVGGSGVTSPAERIDQVTSPVGTETSAGSGSERVAIVQTAWPRIKEDPIVGTGLDSSDTVVSIISGGTTRPYQAHGAPLAAWYEAGILGLLGVLMVFGALAATGWRALKLAGTRDDALIGWGLLSALVAFVVHQMTTPFVFQQYGWLSGAMLVAFWALRYRERDAGAVETPVSSGERAGAHAEATTSPTPSPEPVAAQPPVSHPRPRISGARRWIRRPG
jgi:O-antigen ligase